MLIKAKATTNQPCQPSVIVARRLCAVTAIVFLLLFHHQLSNEASSVTPWTTWSSSSFLLLSSTKRHDSKDPPDNINTVRIALVGDSITYGNSSMALYPREKGKYNKNKKKKKVGSYPLELKYMLDNTHRKDMINTTKDIDLRMYAVSGTTAMKGQHLTRQRHGCSPEFDNNTKRLTNIKSCSFWDTLNFKDLTTFSPHILVIMLGTNDSKDLSEVLKKNFQRDYNNLIKHICNGDLTKNNNDNNNNDVDFFISASSNGRGVCSRILLLLPPDIYAEGLFHISREKINNIIRPSIESINTNIMSSPSQLTASLIDLRKALDVNPFLYMGHSKSTSEKHIGDGIHPLEEGSKLIAQTIYPILHDEILKLLSMN